jgi:hypothetical protein
VRGESDEPRARSARGRRLRGVAARTAAPQRERTSELPHAGVIARAALRDLREDSLSNDVTADPARLMQLDSF